MKIIQDYKNHIKEWTEHEKRYQKTFTNRNIEETVSFAFGKVIGLISNYHSNVNISGSPHRPSCDEAISLLKELKKLSETASLSSPSLGFYNNEIQKLTDICDKCYKESFK